MSKKNRSQLQKEKNMTLIITHISRFGILQASDSNLTARDRSAVEGPKIFHIQHLDAYLSISGSYRVNGRDMDQWMPDFIRRCFSSGSPTLSEFAQRLREELESEMRREEKDDGIMIHMTGYVEEGGESHPEFWFVSNMKGIDPITGEYRGIEDHIGVTEYFWTKHCPKGKLIEKFEAGAYQIYINGYASGRVGFLMLQDKMRDFFNALWNNPNWKFRPPSSIEETEEWMRLYIDLIGTMFKQSDYFVPYIGGDTQICSIPRPENCVVSSPLRTS